MIMFQRLATVLLCLGMLLATLAACANSDPNPVETVGAGETGSDTVKTTDSGESNSGGLKTPTTGEGEMDSKPIGDIEMTPSVLTLKYDDRHTFNQAVKSIEAVRAESKNAVTGESDSVLSFRQEGDKQTVVASGVGTALVTFESGNTCTVTVEKATISMLLIFGQSNEEGWTKKEDPAQYKKAISQSVLCEEGQIYSTYAPSGTFAGIEIGPVIGGVRFQSNLTVQTYQNFVPESLCSDKSVNGKTLDYKLNSLSAAGQGKVGIDSALAYTWHARTGEKVWVINASHGASTVASWQRGGANFSEATLLVKECQRVLKKEIDAGHYVFSQMGYFWGQGIADSSMTSEEYTEAFKQVHTALKEKLAFELNADMPGEEKISFAALILPRAATTHVGEADLALNGIRTSYLYMGISDEDVFSDVWLTSVVGDEFATDKQVTAYFQEKYRSGRIELPLRTEYALPTTAAECHPDIHYRQPGFNELGAEATERILNILEGKVAPEGSTVCVYRTDGVNTYSDGETVRLRQGESLFLGIKLENAPEFGKLIRVESEHDDVSVSYNCITVSNTANAGTVKVKIFASDVLVLTLNVVIPGNLTAVDSGNSTDIQFEDLF